MLEKTLGIVLHIIPYNDKISVAHLYTEQYGRSSYLIPQGGGKKARMFRSLFMPFSILELDIDYRNSRELQKIIEARTVLPLQNIYSDPVKNAEALFLSEVLCQTIKEPEPNLPLFAFIARSIQVLNIMEEGKANFHLCFLLQLCSFLGFSPNMETYRPGYFFDKFSGGPVGLETLAAALGEDAGTLEDVYEPYLLMNGLLNRTPRGRMATEAAYRHLGYAWNQEKNGISEI